MIDDACQTWVEQRPKSEFAGEVHLHMEFSKEVDITDLRISILVDAPLNVETNCTHTLNTPMRFHLGDTLTMTIPTRVTIDGR